VYDKNPKWINSAFQLSIVFEILKGFKVNSPDVHRDKIGTMNNNPAKG
jgi:hypothetical protein